MRLKKWSEKPEIVSLHVRLAVVAAKSTATLSPIKRPVYFGLKVEFHATDCSPTTPHS
jgi:hypothetical protein